MSIILDEDTTTIVQGITGREGSARTRFMKDYGTEIVGGVTPGRGGEEVWGVPVYDTVKEAVEEEGQIDMSVTFIPGPALKDAVLEALEAGVKKIVSPVERVPLHDILEMLYYTKKEDAQILGPGSIGIISPGKAVAGWLGGTRDMAEEVFNEGRIGIISRSGGETTSLCWSLTESGLGQSTALHVGAEQVLGMTPAEVLPLFEEDNQTDAVVMFGEIGTAAEQEAAEVMKEGRYNKPLVAHIVGGFAQEGLRFSHASAIVEGEKGKYENKVKALENAGAKVVESEEKIPETVKEVI